MKGQVFVDLDYVEDSTAEVDLNIVSLDGGKLVEVQGTAENGSFDRAQLNAMLDAGLAATEKLVELQKKVLGAGGFSVRPEWETPYAGHFDFSVVNDLSVREQLEAARLDGLLPVFTTNFTRQRWRVRPTPDTSIELALDRGQVEANSKLEAICEIELELETGNAYALFDLAETLTSQLPVRVALQSKAERGFRLHADQALSPTKASSINYNANCDTNTCFQRIVSNTLAHLLENAAHIASTNIEYLHQSRVALRRLRSALRLFEPLLSKDALAALQPNLRSLGQALGQARDLDVMIEETFPRLARNEGEHPDLQALFAALLSEQQHAHSTAVTALDAQTTTHTALALSRLLHQGLSNTPPDLPDFASAQLGELHRRARKRAKRSKESDLALHALRIAIKRLRYASEFFAPVFTHKSHTAWLATLSRLQEQLGHWNDLVTAELLIQQRAQENASLHVAAAYACGWFAAQRNALREQLYQEIKIFQKPKPHWRAKVNKSDEK